MAVGIFESNLRLARKVKLLKHITGILSTYPHPPRPQIAADRFRDDGVRSWSKVLKMPSRLTRP